MRSQITTLKLVNKTFRVRPVAADGGYEAFLLNQASDQIGPANWSFDVVQLRPLVQVLDFAILRPLSR